MTEPRLVLPLPPTSNRYWRLCRGRIIKSKEARLYQQAAKLRALSEGLRPLDGDLSVHVAVYRKRRQLDLDNTLKIALDALNGIGWRDDAQIARIVAERHEDPDDPRLVVVIEQVVGIKHDTPVAHGTGWFVQAYP